MRRRSFLKAMFVAAGFFVAVPAVFSRAIEISRRERDKASANIRVLIRKKTRPLDPESIERPHDLAG